MKKIILVLMLLVMTNSVAAQLADSPWPMFHGSATHGGISKYDTSHIDGTIKWTFETGEGIESSPVIGEDGTIYFGSHDGYLYALNQDGTLKWKFNTGEKYWDSNYGGQWKSIITTPAIASDGTIYTYSSSNYLIAVNQDGIEKWRYKILWNLDFWSSPAIASDGTIYIGSARDDSNTGFKAGLYAINPDGTLKWVHEERTGVTTPPTVGPDGTIYIGAGIMAMDKSKEDEGKIVAISPDGKEKWQFKVKLWVEGASTFHDGVLYANTKEGDIYALTPDGKEKWRFSTDDGISAAVAIGIDGNLYVGSWDAYFYSLTLDGKLRWKYKTPDAFEGISSHAAVGADGTVYVGSNSGMFYAFNQDGSVKWSLNDSLHSGIITGPAVGKDGTIYFGSWNKKIYAIGKSGDETESHIKETDNQNEQEWNPKDNNVNCLQPDSIEIEEKCDKFCSDHPEYCSDYAKKPQFKEKNFNESKHTEEKLEESLAEEKETSFFEKIIDFFKRWFGK